MKIFFWQNIISLHQLPIITELSKIDALEKVYLIVPEVISKDRQDLGWTIDLPELKKLEIIISPSNIEVEELFSENLENSYHFFSGLRSFPFVYSAFLSSLKYPVKRGLIVEKPYAYKKPLILHKIKALLFDKKHYKDIHYVFAFGEEACLWNKKLNSKWKVFNYVYTVQPPIFNEEVNTGRTRFIYVGSLNSRKNVKSLIHAFSKIDKDCYALDIIGDGPERDEIITLIKKYDLVNNISLKGIYTNNQLSESLSTYDVLLLPSLHDGWGAVVNEALMAGVFVICSNKCGAKDLLDNNVRGTIYNVSSAKLLISQITYCTDNIENIRNNKLERFNWSSCITPHNISNYFFKCLTSENSLPPWK